MSLVIRYTRSLVVSFLLHVCLASHTSTLHVVLQRGKTLRALIKATPLVEVKARLALGAEVFAEAGLAVLYPAPWRKKQRTGRVTGV